MDHLTKINEISEQARQEFSYLTIDQLNWKLHPDKWSIGQCLDHIITANSTYFQVFESIINRKYKSDLWSRLSPFSDYFGNFLIKTLGPERRKVYRSPKVFRPSQSEITPDITGRFIKHNKELISRLNQIIELGFENIVIHSPASFFVTYKVSHAIAIIARHEERHLLQAFDVKVLLMNS